MQARGGRRTEGRHSNPATVAGLEQKTTEELAAEMGISDRTYQHRAKIGRGHQPTTREEREVRRFLLGAIATLVLQVALVGGYLVVSGGDSFLLNPNSHILDKDGIGMAMLCGKGMTPEGRGSEVLNNMPPDGDLGPWYRGRTVQGDCNIFYHYGIVNGHIVGD